MLAIFCRPRGRLVTDWMQFKDGDTVDVCRMPYDRMFSRTLRDASIRHKKVCRYGSLTMTEIWIDHKSKSYELGFFYTGDDYDGEFHKSTIEKWWLYKFNGLIKEPSMANKLLALVKLDKSQRRLAKVGIYDENGNLTDDGQEVLLNMLAKDNESKLIDLVKDWKDDKDCKKKSDD